MNLTFAQAVEEMGNGKKVGRQGWNGKSMFIFLIAGDCWGFECDIEGVDGIQCLPFLCMKTADNKLVPWLASQTDIISKDWIVID